MAATVPQGHPSNLQTFLKPSWPQAPKSNTIIKRCFSKIVILYRCLLAAIPCSEPGLPLQHPREGPVAASPLLKGTEKHWFTFKNWDPCESQCWRQLSTSANSSRCLMASCTEGTAESLIICGSLQLELGSHTPLLEWKFSFCHLFSQQMSEHLGKGVSFLAPGRTSRRSAREYLLHSPWTSGWFLSK